MDCIFCKLINNEIPSNKIYEDDLAIAFLDVEPINNGHALVIPKKHYTSIEDADDATLLHLMKVIKKLYPKIMEALEADGITIIENYGLLQAVPHMHFHIVPIFKNHVGITMDKINKPDDFKKIAKKICTSLK
ncbi:MAG: HIT family protein [Lachnospirales bacterium]